MPGRAVVILLLALGALLAVVASRFAPRLRLKPHSLEALETVAVMPFDNRSGDPELELLASTIAETLVASLEKGERVKVVPARKSLMFKDLEGGIARIAAELDAAYVVTGSLDRVEDRIEVDFYLFRSGDEQGLWAERHAWPLEKRDSIAGELAERLAGSLASPDPAEEPRSLPR
ncbi:MAG TPA: hypothetical protein VEK15_32990 [Vicinamibacteria bacterium]|nr:hypothetical protein [Vicinamibacteria bacterium]